MFFNRKKNQDKPENDDAKSEKGGFFSFFNRATPTEKAAPEAVDSETTTNAEIEIVEAEVADTRVIINETFVEKTAEDAALPEITTDDEPARPKTDPVAEKPKSLSWFARIKQGLARTSSQFSEGLGNLLMGKKAIDDELLEELETQLLVADVGIDATTEIIDQLTKSVERKQLADSDALYLALQAKLEDMLIPAEHPLVIDTSKKPFVILVVGVNGVGKTTTIGKLAYQLRQEGKSVMLAAGDTFRAAAVEQLQVWGERNDIHVVAQHTGADSASVIFDAISSAKAKALDVVICDTAGRLHNKNHLMDELAKVRRVIAKLDPTAPHESLLVLDAGTGQNAVSQTENFRTTAGVTGLVLTKLDGTAKGGIIFALSQKFKLPVRFIGVGEGIEDLQTFRAKAFVDALFNRNV
ncbi:MAG: signal recognition particle-docking protein FtsY [Marinagarivorans sp.]|nr:signal recognition particle-docking protein FtsY [Marinagarivorans sp.]